MSGSRFYYLTGQGAELELALINLAMSTAMANGFIPFIPPSLVKSQAMEGTGFLGQAAQDVYHLEEDDLCLVGTSEVPLAAYDADEILDPDTLPRHYVGLSPCYRRRLVPMARTPEGSFGCIGSTRSRCSFSPRRTMRRRSTRGCCSGRRTSSARRDPFQVIELAAGDLGFSAARKYDCNGGCPLKIVIARSPRLPTAPISRLGRSTSEPRDPGTHQSRP